MRKLARLVVVLQVLLVAAVTMVVMQGGLGGCGGGGGGSKASPPTVNVSGNWSGSWLSSNGVSGGAITFLPLMQNGSMLSGQINFTGSPCFSGGALSGVVSGSGFTGSLTAGSIRVDVDGTVTGNQMNGTYDTVNAGACTGDTGTFTASR